MVTADAMKGRSVLMTTTKERLTTAKLASAVLAINNESYPQGVDGAAVSASRVARVNELIGRWEAGLRASSHLPAVAHRRVFVQAWSGVSPSDFETVEERYKALAKMVLAILVDMDSV